MEAITRILTIYLDTYQEDFRLPTKWTREFFNPPIGYLFFNCPSDLQKCYWIKWFFIRLPAIYGKVTPLFQSFMYIFTIFSNLATLKSINNSNKLINVSYLILIFTSSVTEQYQWFVESHTFIFWYIFISNICMKKWVEFNFKYIFYTGLVIGAIAICRRAFYYFYL